MNPRQISELDVLVLARIIKSSIKGKPADANVVNLFFT